jgi:hypothetical protein
VQRELATHGGRLSDEGTYAGRDAFEATEDIEEYDHALDPLERGISHASAVVDDIQCGLQPCRRL